MGRLLSYFTDRHIAPDSPYVWVGIGLSIAFLLIGLIVPLIVWIQRRRNSKRVARISSLYNSLAGVMRTIGSIELILYFLRYQSIFPFTNRMWVWVVALAGGVWAIIIWNKYRKILPEYQKEDILYDRFSKYLPKSKRRSV